tara:strand:+ start:27 stop:587 length:561 start_codon:yes stop_codon:yes gene_type:complete
VTIEINNTSIKDVKLVIPAKYEDSRGFFAETWNMNSLAKKGINLKFVQENHSFSYKQRTLRGLHFQKPPYSQLKLVRCGRGAFLDVFVDIRPGSETFGSWGSEVISFENRYQLIIPEGFAHGFLTLEDNTEIVYKCSEFYKPSHEVTLRYDDSDLNIDWKFDSEDFHLSEKDKKGISFTDASNYFM